MVVGIDTGGTLSDVFLEQAGEGPVVVKVPSDRDDPGRAVIQGLLEAARIGGFSPSDVVRLAHGTTVATNALREGISSSVALITTDGFRDVLEIGTTKRPPAAQYDVHWDPPDVLIPRSTRFEVQERLSAAGKVLQELSKEEVTTPNWQTGSATQSTSRQTTPLTAN